MGKKLQAIESLAERSHAAAETSLNVQKALPHRNSHLPSDESGRRQPLVNSFQNQAITPTFLRFC